MKGTSEALSLQHLGKNHLSSSCASFLVTILQKGTPDVIPRIFIEKHDQLKYKSIREVIDTAIKQKVGL
jgi:hypothetical protein